MHDRSGWSEGVGRRGSRRNEAVDKEAYPTRGPRRTSPELGFGVPQVNGEWRRDQPSRPRCRIRRV
ncbi:hypothetical protein SUS17_2136 [Sphingomonas sp. S17]|nr:hypothetical protein SUS17_2136 [Sphingomonas sp. S17]